MKNISSLISTLIIAAIAGAGASYWVTGRQINTQTPETAYQRVIRTNTLRCGYWVFPPSTNINPKTNKVEGLSVAIVEEMAKRLGLKVEWAEEVSFGTMLAGLETRRYDAVCTGAFITAARSRHAELTVPFLFSGIIPVVRADDTRFDKDITLANDPSITVSAMDGDITSEIATQKFPKARMLAIPAGGNYSDVYMNLTTKKADIFFEDAGRIKIYMKNNPDQFKILNVDKPLRISPWAFPVNKGEHELIGLLNGVLTEMLYDDSIQRLAKAYEPLTEGYYYFKPPIEAK